MTNNKVIQKLLTTASVVFIFIAIVPFVFIGYTFFGVSWSTFVETFAYYQDQITTTVSLSVMTGIASLILSLTVLIALMNLPSVIRKITTAFLIVPLLFPPYIAAISYIDIFKSPFALSLMGRSSFIEFVQAVFVLSLFLFPYSFLLIKNRLEMLDPTHRKIMSLYKWKLFDKIRLLYLPHLKGALLGGFIIPFLYVVSDFGAVSILRMDTVTIELYQSMVRRFEYVEGAILSLILLGISSLALIAGSHMSSHPVQSLRKDEATEVQFKRRNPGFLISVVFIAVVLIVSVGVPLAQIGSWFIQFVRENSVLKDIWFDFSMFHTVILTSIIISLMAVALTQLTAFIVLLTHIFVRESVIVKSIYFITALLYALPAIVIAFSVLVFKYVTPYAISYALLFMLFAYVLRFVGIAIITSSAAVETIPKAYLRIGSTFIPGIGDIVRIVILPYLKKYLFQSGNYIYFLSLRELTIPLILLPVGMNVLSVRIWQTASEGMYVYASPLILVLLLLSLPSLIWYIKNQL